VGETFAVEARATSGLPVTVSLLAGPATIAQNKVTFWRPGEVKIRLTQEGNEQFEAAPETVATFHVGKARQTITVEPLPEQIFCGDRIVIKAAASSQLPVSFRVLSGPAQLTGWQVAIINGPGKVEIEASQVGNDKILAAKTTISFTATKRPQEIRFTELQGEGVEGPGFAFRAAATSGLPVGLSLVSGQATIRESALILTGLGPV